MFAQFFSTQKYRYTSDCKKQDRLKAKGQESSFSMSLRRIVLLVIVPIG